MSNLKTALGGLLILLATAGSPVPADEAQAERGAALYMEHCADCHGPQGRGDGPKARRLGFRPRDLSLASFKCRCTPSGELATDEDLLQTLERGLAGTPMTGFAGKIPPDGLRAVVAHVKTLSPRMSGEAAPECIPVPPDPGSDPALVAEGLQVYRLLGCLRCHGSQGRGDGPSASELRDDWGDEIRPYDFTRRRWFKCGAEPTDLYRTLHTGMNGSPMPSYAEAFLFAGNPADADSLEPYLDATSVGRLRTYLSSQPAASTLADMEEPQQRDLVERRSWALVHYLLSLANAPRD